MESPQHILALCLNKVRYCFVIFIGPPPSSGSTYTGGPGGSSLYGNTNSLYSDNTYRPPGSVPGSYSGLSSNGIGTTYG